MSLKTPLLPPPPVVKADSKAKGKGKAKSQPKKAPPSASPAIMQADEDKPPPYAASGVSVTGEIMCMYMYVIIRL